MKISKNQELILIRYSDMFGYDTIMEHKKIIDENKYCYFGKVGKKSSNSHIKNMLNSKEPAIILKSKNNTYIAVVDGIVFEKPNDHYPKYYEKELFEKNNFPSIYFKLIKIIKMDKKYLNNFIVKSSLNSLPQALQQSMTSQLLVKCEREFIIEED